MASNASSLAVGRLCDKSGSHLGTAFAVSSSRALTAFHLIGDRGTGAVVHQHVLLKFSDQSSVLAEYVAGDHQADYAVLSIKSPLPASLVTIPLMPRAVVHEGFRCAGYPSSLQGPDITFIGGVVRADQSSIFGGVPAIQLFSNEGAAGLSLQGMSGAPVLVRNPEAAIGLIRWNPPRATSPDLGVGGIVFSCPVQLMLDKHPELAASVVPVNYEAKIAELVPLLAALKPPDRDLLSQALTGLHREKLAKNEVRGLQPEWTAIPYWRFAFPIGRKPEEFRREFLKTIIRIVGRCLEELVARSVPEVQILTLLKLSIDGDVWQISLACPLQEVVAYLLDHTPPRATVDQMRKDVERLASDIHHQYTIVEGPFTPIVFQYKPVLRQLLVTNRNQVNTPDYFLNPHLCTTTSGFLNFIGTLNLQAALKFPPGKIPVIQFEDFEKLFNAGLDHWFAWLYHWMDTGTLFDLKRLFIGTKDSEQYRYYYVPTEKSDTQSRASTNSGEIGTSKDEP